MRQILAFGVVALLAVACGGVSTIGKGNGAENNGGAGGSGNAANGGDPGKGGDPNVGGGDPGKGGSAGVGGGSTGVACKEAADCITPGLCRACPDGTQACNKADCINGQCAMLLSYALCPGEGPCDPATCPASPNAPGCCLPDGSGCGLDYGKGCQGMPAKCDPALCSAGPNEKPCCMPDGLSCGVDTGAGCGLTGSECKIDADCPVPPPFCQLCDDGTCAPAFTRCNAGKCESGLGECAGQRHWVQTCGDVLCSDPGNPTGVRPCEPAKGEKETGPCNVANDVCDPGYGCGVLLQCGGAQTPCPK